MYCWIQWWWLKMTTVQFFRNWWRCKLFKAESLFYTHSIRYCVVETFCMLTERGLGFYSDQCSLLCTTLFSAFIWNNNKNTLIRIEHCSAHLCWWVSVSLVSIAHSYGRDQFIHSTDTPDFPQSEGCWFELIPGWGSELWTLQLRAEHSATAPPSPTCRKHPHTGPFAIEGEIYQLLISLSQNDCNSMKEMG